MLKKLAHFSLKMVIATKLHAKRDILKTATFSNKDFVNGLKTADIITDKAFKQNNVINGEKIR